MQIVHAHGRLTIEGLNHLLADHYLGRKPPMSDTFEAHDGGRVVAVLTTGSPGSRHVQVGVCPDKPGVVTELNRLWVADDQPHGFASRFIASCFKMMPPRIVVSYADTAAGHDGTVYRAANFYYAGWTDMDRKTPRFDYIVPGKHPRDAFRGGDGLNSERVRRKPKARYWTVTGTRRDKRDLRSLCAWPIMCWHQHPVPTEHRKLTT